MTTAWDYDGIDDEPDDDPEATDDARLANADADDLYARGAYGSADDE